MCIVGVIEIVDRICLDVCPKRFPNDAAPENKQQLFEKLNSTAVRYKLSNEPSFRRREVPKPGQKGKN